MRILLVDDDEGVLAIEQSWLVQAGHAVDTARNNKEALTFYDNESYDVVLTDVEHLEVHGPDGGEGLELARVIRKRNPSQRIGFNTAHSCGVTGTHSCRITGYPTLHKGFEPEQFLGFVEELSQTDSVSDNC